MTPLARRILVVVVGTLVLAVVVLAASLSPGPTAQAGLLLLGAGLVVVGVITAVMLGWFRKEVAATNRSSAVEIDADADVDPETLDAGRRSGDGASGRDRSAPDGSLSGDGTPGEESDDGPRRLAGDDRRDGSGEE